MRVARVFTTPDAFVFFGILHAIAMFSLLSVIFTRIKPGWALGLAVVVFVLG